jgi:hypothetical protein
VISLKGVKMNYLRNTKTARIAISFVVLLVCLFSLSDIVLARDEKEAAEEIFNKWQDAVVTVKVVVNVRFVVEGRESDEMEEVIETVATFIDPSGLAVLSYSSVDPMRILGEFLGQMQNIPNVNIESDITDVKMLMTEGHEIPASVVMRDNDLDLVFIKSIKKMEKPVNAIDLTKHTGELSVMDEVYILTRLGHMTGRIPSISLFYVEAIVKKPRIFYVIDENAMSGRLGAPAFSIDGKIVGLLILNRKQIEDKQFSVSDLFGGASRTGILPGILPAREIATVAKQALESQKEKGKE